MTDAETQSLKKLTDVIDPEKGLTLVSYIHTLKFGKDRVRGLKIQKINDVNPQITQTLMTMLLSESYDSFNFGKPLQTKYLANVAEYVMNNFPHESINDWAGFCYKLSVGELFEPNDKVYRLGQSELIQLWRDFIDNKWERVETNYNKAKEKRLSTPVQSEPGQKADPDRVAELLDAWRRERVRETIEADKAKDSNSKPIFDEKAYLKGVLLRVTKMSVSEISDLCLSFAAETRTLEYVKKVAKVISQEKIELIKKDIRSRKTTLAPAAIEALLENL